MDEASLIFLPLVTIFHFVLPKLLDVTSVTSIPLLMLFNLACWSPFYLVPGVGEALKIPTTRFYLVSSWTGNLICSTIISFIPPLLLGSSLLRSVSLIHMIGSIIFFLTLEESLRINRDRLFQILPFGVRQYLNHPIIATLIQALIITVVSSFLGLTVEIAMIATVALILSSPFSRLKIRDFSYITLARK
jgi:hypothetical protein